MRADGDVYFAVRSAAPATGTLSAPAGGGHGPGRGRRGRKRGGTRSTSPCGRGRRRARTPPGTRPGAAAARGGTSSAPPWPRRSSARGLRDPRRGQRPRLPAPRERGGADPRRRGTSRARADLDAQRDAPDEGREDGHGREDGQVRRQRLLPPRGRRGAGAGRARPVASARATTGSRSRTPPRRVRGGGRPRPGRIREAGRRLVPGPRGPEALAPLKERFFAALARDFNTTEALAAVDEWVREANRGPPRAPGAESDLREMLDVLALAPLLDAADAAGPGAEALALLRAPRSGAGGQGTGPPRTPCGTSWPPWAGPSATRRGRRRSSCARGPVRGLLYGRNPVREALRGRRRVLQVWATERAAPASRGWGAGVPVEIGPAERDIEHRCGAEAHQGICAEAGRDSRTSGSGELLEGVGAERHGSSSPSTGSRTPRTSGRSAAARRRRAWTGVAIPERRAAEITPAGVQGPRRAPWSTCGHRAEPGGLPARGQGP